MNPSRRITGLPVLVAAGFLAGARFAVMAPARRHLRGSRRLEVGGR